jgi:hypothetical protein
MKPFNPLRLKDFFKAILFNPLASKTEKDVPLQRLQLEKYHRIKKMD